MFLHLPLFLYFHFSYVLNLDAFFTLSERYMRYMSYMSQKF